MAKTFDDLMAEAGGAARLLWESQTPMSVVPRVTQEFTNWRSEQQAWRSTAVLYDQCHHMADLNIKGPDALKLLKKLAVNSMEHFPVDMAKQFVAVNHDGYMIGDNVLFHLEEDEYQAVGIPTTINWIQFHAETGGYDVRVWRDDNSAIRKGDPVNYRYQLQGPGAMDVIRAATGAEPPKLKFFYMTRFTIGGCEVRALRHGMAGEPGLEIWGPWEEREKVHAAILEAGKAFNLTQVGGRAYHTNVLESGWWPRPIPAIYSDPRLKDYRDWLGANCYEAVAPLGGSFYSENIEDYYCTPFDLDYGRLIAFDHDFIGREALEKMVAEGRDKARYKRTLVWNAEDVTAAIGSSMFGEGPGAKFMNLPVALYDTFHCDRIEVDGKVVGISNWTGYSSNERAMLSLCYLDAAFAEPGTEVTVVWGENTPSSKVQVEDHVQVKIRAVVQPAPLVSKARTVYRSNEAL
ncbi:aminomethyl transferase family protein [Arenibacterium sp. LLYu02]|uniref:aminomethyl transferase family protein n=1 Tax=Arenibacterium sp. LLYu02 TaxID=3404132 RepID=UPI003B223A12